MTHPGLVNPLAGRTQLASGTSGRNLARKYAASIWFYSFKVSQNWIGSEL